MIPYFKVTVTHGGAPVTYTNDVFKYIQIKKRENNYDVATLHFPDKDAYYYEDYFDVFDDIKIWTKATAAGSYTTNPQFGGTIRQVVPSVDIGEGYLPRLVCKSYGAAFEATNCNRDYGIESANPNIPAAWGILKNVVAEFTEKSFADAATGHDIDNSFVSDYCATEIKYMNNPFRNNLDALNVVCQLTSAIGAGTTAGGHWITMYDATGATARFLFAKIGDHAAGGDSPESHWPDWWNTNQAGSTLVQGDDFLDYSVVDKAEEFANNVLLLTDFRRPAYDYWTNNEGITNDGIWSVQDCTATAVSAAPAQVVGDKCLKITCTDPVDPGIAYFDFSGSGNLDVTKIGSIRTIPRLNFYSYKPAGLDETQTYVRLYTTDFETDYWQCQFSQISQSDDVWAHKSIPIGPYWQSDTLNANNEFVWVGDGGEDWTSIKGLAFVVQALTYIGVDDLHFSGKLVRSAYDSDDITAHKEYQKVCISRNAMDDSCIAEDDTGFAARVAYAELLRRMALPQTITFSTCTDMKAALAGQKLHVHACKQSTGDFRINTDMRILEITHEIGEGVGYKHTVTATTDLLNSFPISVPDQFAMWQENLFLNSKEAKNIRSGAEVDLLIPMLIKDYA